MISMQLIKSIFHFFKEWLKIIFQFIGLFFKTSAAKNLEILALRQQLSVCQQQIENKKRPKPRVTNVFRQFWVLLSKIITSWKSWVILVKPETVIRWHETAFKLHWKSKSKKIGRPKLPDDIIDMIIMIHEDNPNFKSEKIHEVLVSMNVIDIPAPNPSQ